MKWAGLDVQLEGKGDGPVIVLLHGFGAPGDDLVGLAQALAIPGARYVFPAGPIELPAMYGDARAWWLLDMRRLDREIASGGDLDFATHTSGMPAARAQMEALLVEAGRHFGSDAPIIVGGFSQGSMLACDLAVHAVRPPAKLVVLSGILADDKAWTPRFPSLTAMKVFQSHGRQDPIVPFRGATALRDRMQAAGMSVDWVEFNGGHEIPRVVLARLREFLLA